MSVTFPSVPPLKASRRLISFGLVFGLLVAELLVISLLYQHGFDFTCRAAAPAAFCAFAGRIIPRVLGALAVLTLFLLARRAPLQDLLAIAGPRDHGILLNLTGFALILLPWFGLSDSSSSTAILLAALSWSIGGILATSGIALMVAPTRAWIQLLSNHGVALVTLLVLGLALPELADQLQPLWRIEAVTAVTFAAVAGALGYLGYVVETNPVEKVIANADFGVAVGPQCSGVEGFMLITVFLTLYVGLFRRDLRFPNVLLLYPIGLLLSFLFNILRITVLLVIGFEGQPDLAVGAFHSHAGWLAFTTLSLLLILASRAVPGFAKTDLAQTSTPLPPFFQDPAVARILPFVVFMASALLVSTLSETPSVHYLWRTIAMGTALALIWPFLHSLPWRIDPLALASGGAIAVMWIAVAPASGDAPYGTLAGMAWVIWLIARIIGTTFFVPIIEELFFRDYLISRLAPNGDRSRMVLAVAISTAAFAIFHDRWIIAGVAGLVFAGLVWRSRNVTDAILAHGIANGLIALWAFSIDAWHIL